MPLADRLRGAPKPGECSVCAFYQRLPDTDRTAFDGWLAEGGSMAELYRQCRDEADDQGQPLTISERRFHQCVTNHLRLRAVNGAR